MNSSLSLTHSLTRGCSSVQVSKDKATSGVTMDSASGAATAAAVEEADVIWDELRVERLLGDYGNPSANPDPGVPSGPWWSNHTSFRMLMKIMTATTTTKLSAYMQNTIPYNL